MGIQYKGDAVAVPPAGVTLNTLYNDKVVDPYTKFVFDASDTHSWTSQAAMTPNSTWVDLSPVGANATATGSATMNYTGGGFVFTGSNTSQQIRLPLSAKPASTSVGFLATVWLRVGTVAQGIANVCGWHSTAAATSSWGMYANGGSGRQYVMYFDGGAQTYTFPAEGVYQVGFGRCSDDDGATFLRKVYIRSNTNNAVGLTSQASGATAVQYSGQSYATLGLDTQTGLGGVFNGTIYRSWFWDVGTTTGIGTSAKLLSIMDTDWNDNKGRWS